MGRQAARPPAARSPLPPRRRRKELRPGEILDAAFEEFAVNGFAATRLDDVARRAGIAKGTIYVYFKNKEQLFRAVVRKLIVPILEQFDAAAVSFSGTTEDLVRQLLSKHYAKVVSNPKARALLRLMVAESSRFPQLAEIYYREVIERGRKIIQRVLARGMESGEFSRAKAADFPQMLMAPAALAVLWMLIFGERHPLDLNAYREAHLDLILNGVKASQRAT